MAAALAAGESCLAISPDPRSTQKRASHSSMVAYNAVEPIPYNDARITSNAHAALAEIVGIALGDAQHSLLPLRRLDGGTSPGLRQILGARLTSYSPLS